MLLGQNGGQLLAGLLTVALQHHADALLRRRKALEDVGGRALQADGGSVDQGMILQVLIAQSGQGLAVGRQDAADGHIAGVVQLLDAGDQAGSLNLDGHIAILQHTLDGDGVAFLGDVGGVFEAYGKPLTTLGYEDLKDDPLIDATTIGLKGSPTNIFKSFTPPQKGAGMMLEGADKATCEKLAGILAAKHII